MCDHRRMRNENASLDSDQRSAAWRFMVWVLTGVFMVMLVFAAASGPVRVWTNPSADVNDQVAGVAPVEPDASSAPSSDDGGGVSWDGGLLNMVAAVLVAVLVVGALLAAGELRPSLWMWRLDRRSRTAEEVDVLPEVFERLMRVDIDAARAALSGGTPRNAIVRCWMQLERLFLAPQ